jgi:hypothetical protein
MSDTHGKIADSFALAILLVFGLTSVPSASARVSVHRRASTLRAAAPVPSPTPSPSLSPEAQFLLLPAHDLDRVNVGDSAAAIRVGDTIQVRVSDFAAVVASASTASPAPSSEPSTQPSSAPAAPIAKAGAQSPVELTLQPAPGADEMLEQGWEIGPPDSQGLIRLSPLQGGHITLPSLAIQAKQPDGTFRSVARTNPFSLDVVSKIKPDEPESDPVGALLPPIALKFPWWVLVAGGVLALAILTGAAILLRRYLTKRQGSQPPKPVEPPRPEHEIALEKLAALEKTGPLSRGEFKGHYFGVSEIVKAYAGARYGFDAVESTTREMIQSLESKVVLTKVQLDQLESMFERLDRVKFTDHVPTPDEGQRLLDLAREFVLVTRRPPPEIAVAGASVSPATQTGGAQR